MVPHKQEKTSNKKFNFKRLDWGQVEVHLFQIMLLPGGQVDVIHSLFTPARTLFMIWTKILSLEITIFYLKEIGKNWSRLFI